MRRLRIAQQTSGRTCLALFRWERGDPLLPQTRALWSVYENPGDWYVIQTGNEGGAPWIVSAEWPFMFVFADGLIGMARGPEIHEALASVGLRLS